MQRKTRMTLCAAAVAAINCTARPATWYVDDDPIFGCDISHASEDGSATYPFDGIQEALDAASDGDTIMVAAGTYIGDCNRGLDFHGKDVVLVGEDCDTTIIDCEGSDRAFHFDDGEPSSAKVINIKVINGYRSSGGAVYCENDSNPTFEHCCFRDNQAWDEGGAVYAILSSPTFIDCSFVDNGAGDDGGAIYQLTGDLALTGCIFSGNEAANRGGAVMLLSSAWATLIATEMKFNDADQGAAMFIDNDSHAQLNACQVHDNEAVGDAGAIYLDRGSEATLQTCAVNANIAGGSGGAIVTTESTLEIHDTIIAGNDATGDGGGLMATDSVTTITGSKFNNNSGGNGGGLRADRGTIDVAHTDFRTNQANSGGGAYHAGSDNELQPATYKWCRFIGHDIGGLGGGMYLKAVDMLIHNGGYYGNVCNDGGGGIYVRDASELEVANTAFSCNYAMLGSSGGGMRIRLDSVVELANTTFSRNSAPYGDGGGMIVEDADVNVVNTILWNNSDAGGSDCDAQLYDTGAGTVTVIRSDVMDPTSSCPAWSTGTNFYADPLFLDDDGPDNTCGTEDDDLRIGIGSPCIDRANNNALPDDVLNIDDDTDLSEPLPLDLAAKDRFIDDPATADTGIAHVVATTLPIADVGAYEYEPSPVCPWDLDRDGEVGTGDFLELLAGWGDYGTEDFLELLAHWGPCS